MRTIIALSLALIAGAAFGSDALADEDGGRRCSRAERMERFDTNGDGELDQAERAAARAARRARMDTNGDGVVDADERKAARRKRRGRRGRRGRGAR